LKSTTKSNDITTIAWSDALSSFKVFGSQTPEAFTHKRAHFPNNVAGSTSAVFVDVLRASTTLLTVAAAGCNGIFVDVKPDDGRYLFAPPAGLSERLHWIYGGELNGRPVDGTDSTGAPKKGVVGNSPLSIAPNSLEGKYLRFFSTNGSRALRSMSRAGLASTYAMSIANMRVTVEAILAENPARVWFVCGGFYGSVSLEDCVACGLAIQFLIDATYVHENELDDEAQAMLYTARQFSIYGKLNEHGLTERLRAGQVGRLLTQIGRDADIMAAVSGAGIPDSLQRRMAATHLRSDSEHGQLLKPFLHLP
jgi:phosphosulfolactate phosphohydrolase-like enzyme